MLPFSSTSIGQLLEAAEAWIDGDPDDETKRELLQLLGEVKLSHPDRADRSSSSSLKELEDRVGSQLEFGTAGLRGVMGAGPNRFNLAVVLRATYGVGKVIFAQGVQKDLPFLVVIGYDARPKSELFARAIASVFNAMGISVSFSSQVCPTPLVAFATKYLKADCGIMVTASHNPRGYNGYKVYWSDGAQILSPVDQMILSEIHQVGSAKSVPTMSEIVARKSGLFDTLPEDVERSYLAGIRELISSDEKNKRIKLVYTPLHGVGQKFMLKALHQAGFFNVISVKSQAEPDGQFPTTPFPNPEERGALDEAFAVAKKERPHLILANDPDADRLSVAVPKDSDSTEYVQLTGNQVGVLLGYEVLLHILKKEAFSSSPSPAPFLFINTIVSSPMLAEIVKKHGMRHEETLTGFKWIARKAKELKQSEGLVFAFGYEEALGYCVGELVSDKDGISSAVLFADLASRLANENLSVLEHLNSLYRRYGLYLSSQRTLTRVGQGGHAELLAIMTKIKERPLMHLNGCKLHHIVDYESSERWDVKNPSKRTSLAFPKSQVLAFHYEDKSRIVLRPSGTEPKMKIYFDICQTLEKNEAVPLAKERAEKKMKICENEMMDHLMDIQSS